MREYLTDKCVLILMHFMVSIAQDFESFMKPLQNQRPMIHVLHLKCIDLIHSLLQRFMENDKVMRSKEPTKRIGANKLVDLNIDDASNHKVNQIYKSVFFSGDKSSASAMKEIERFVEFGTFLSLYILSNK